MIEKKKKKKELVVLGGQYVVVAVSWLSEKNIYIHREERRSRGIVLRKRK